MIVLRSLLSGEEASPAGGSSRWSRFYRRTVSGVIRGKGARVMAEQVTDPVCGMRIDAADAVASAEHEGQTFYFCSARCHEAFVDDPHRYGHPED